MSQCVYGVNGTPFPTTSIVFISLFAYRYFHIRLSPALVQTILALPCGINGEESAKCLHHPYICKVTV